MRTPLFMANWKMNKTGEETKAFASHFRNPTTKSDVVICAPFTALPTLSETLCKDVAIGAQNFYPQQSGAYTGEIALDMLKEWRCRYVLVGHSERRLLFGESNELVADKYGFAAEHGMIPVLCLGETKEEREADRAIERCLAQLDAVFHHISPAALPVEIIVAYEPVWAIGTGLTATAEDAEEICSALRRRLGTLLDKNKAEKARLLYGGSVKPDNIAELMAKPNIDGALVGGASLKSDDFSILIEKGSDRFV